MIVSPCVVLHLFLVLLEVLRLSKLLSDSFDSNCYELHIWFRVSLHPWFKHSCKCMSPHRESWHDTCTHISLQVPYQGFYPCRPSFSIISLPTPVRPRHLPAKKSPLLPVTLHCIPPNKLLWQKAVFFHPLPCPVQNSVLEPLPDTIPHQTPSIQPAPPTSPLPWLLPFLQESLSAAIWTT